MLLRMASVSAIVLSAIAIPAVTASAGGRTWFQPVNEILRTFGLTLRAARGGS